MKAFFNKGKDLHLFALALLLVTASYCRAGDVDMQMTTTDGSTKVTFQNSSSVEVASVTSQGDAYFRTITPAQALNMGNHQINNLAAPTAGMDAVTKNYVDTATGSVNTSSLLSSNNTWSGVNTYSSSVTVNNAALLGASGQAVTISSNLVVNAGGTISGNGSWLTSLTPGNISAGVATNVSGLGSQGQALNMNSHQINNVTDPTGLQDAATRNFVNTATNSVNTSSLLSSNNTWSGVNTYSSSVTVNNAVLLGAGGAYTVTISSNAALPGSTFYQNGAANIGSGQNIVISSATIQLYVRSLATLQTTVPSGAGILYYCSTCVNTPICISTGTTTFAVASSSKTKCN